ncbi:Putative exported protein [Thioalkalivibrio nitratireducens DSM 14787]|uniref:Exported protein n=1 Tax=Thioalkalivibrio nitratireducens (strain DSM 14787 / UNIQEM 213 / ALEN2) TaxID=1255043 RepID=L0DUY7_THIND|nr:lipopolysaccharide assembly protein LapA domain-containing protein [Thioalkalivibrio nitratireducens]AGA32833.1 Putative exported protein [Thioalkalivibrio nitratireducens DSM 14787]
MRYIYIALIILLTVVVLVFTFQNLGAVTVQFLTLRLTLPLSALIILVYFLGLVTGGAVVSLVRSWIRGSSGKASDQASKSQ